MIEKVEEKSKIIKTSKEYKQTIIEEKDKEWTKKLNDILSRSSFCNDELDKIKALIPKEILTNENVGEVVTDPTINYIGEKRPRLDILAEDEENNHINIEMQRVFENDYLERAEYYLSRVHGRKLEEGKEYKEIGKTIGIHILNHVKYNHIEDYVNCLRLTMDEHPDIYSSKTALYFIELPKIHKSDYIVNRIMLWGKLISNPSSLDVRVIAKNDSIIKKALDRLKELGSNEEYLLNLKRGAYIMNKSRNFKEEIERETAIRVAKEKDYKIIIMLKKNGFKLDDILNKFNDFDLSEDEIKEVYENN
ncbi:Rpn family recombination-promoting nuclease/putative transposase [Clostridioides difficile]|uniref:Rpn family recombination-promoting nuclease/putative transposase n=1 Tax=Clostridioides difficile TaxID=1496 RepID=UPI001C167401|nr:Rpn family recombination-promoting nuclease/putative transposase [Clostridioides difficile]MDI6221522.1 Rpn family recombination-promoting nuclease/putative transposase [Clostridioides difficile]MDM0265327.1 Rpn family recombination-promoting nuclease/putative transposase [Clostridioides difficile]MDM0349381.1 Rpn family recombination-promoting nuclease/putative transposase [Clostridioides difficile]MDM0382532.1 Rpn family recombination-promoting nuclease/putative transposase [Clostridioides